MYKLKCQLLKTIQLPNLYLNSILEYSFVNSINVGTFLLKWLIVGVIITNIKTRTG